MSFLRPFRPLFVALLGALAAAAPAHPQNFSQPTVIPTGNWPVSMSARAPFPSIQGIPDLLYCDPGINGASQGCHQLRANGDGTFALVQDYLRQQLDGTFTAAFFNFSSFEFSVATLTNSSQGGTGLAYELDHAGSQFPIQGTQAAVPGPMQFIVYDTKKSATDFTNTGILAEELGNGYIYTIAFAGPSDIVGPVFLVDGPGPYLTGDFDGDDKTDILELSTSNQVLDLYLGKGDGTFTFSRKITVPGGIFSMLVQDIDGDSIPDLVVEGANGALSYFPGSATGFSTTAIPLTGAQDGTTGNGGHLIAIADLNNDGNLDIITSTPAGISVLLGQGGLSYKLGGIYNAGPGRSSYALADFNGDGHLDLAVDSPEGIAILYGNADGSFQTSLSFSAGLPAYAIGLGQFTSTGNTDAIVATGIPEVQLLNGDGNGGFHVQFPPFLPLPFQTNSDRTMWSSIAVGDFDGDGNLDAAVTIMSNNPVNSFPDIVIDFGNGAGSFPHSDFQTNNLYTRNTSSIAADFNGDGISDLADFQSGGCAVAFGINTFDGEMAVSLLPQDVAEGTYNAGSEGTYNTGAVGFLRAGRSNKQDLVCQSSTDLRVFRNNGDGTFVQTAVIAPPSNFAPASPLETFPATGLFPSAVLLADLDGDGNGDLIVVYQNLAADPAHPTAATPNQIYIYWGKGDGTFSTPLIQSTTRNYSEAAVADIDGDGKQDLVLSDAYVLGVLPGAGNRSFGTERHYLAGMGINGIATATIDGQTALIVANGGAVLSNPAVNRGILASNAEVNTGGITVLLNPRLPIGITPTLTVTPPNPGYGRTFTLSATLGVASQILPTGTVDFSIDGVTVATTVPVISGVATFTPSLPLTYAVGPHTWSVSYSGDIYYLPQTFTSSLDVTLLPSQTSMSNIASPIFYGQIIGDVAVGTVAPLDPTDTASLLGGTISFSIDGTTVCSLPVNGTSQTCPSPTGAGYNSGTYMLISMYSGNQFYSSSVSPNYPVVVLADVTNPGTLTSSLNPATLGQSVTFTAVFTAPFATPTGTVTFFDGSTPLGTATLDTTGTATLTLSNLALGTHTVTATYAGNINFAAASSNPLQQTILPAPLGTLTTLRSSSNPSTLGQTVTFTATVIFNPVRLGTPIGRIGFTIDGVDVPGVPSSTQASASATFSTSTLALGSHNIVAFFIAAIGTSSPTSNSTSPTLVQVVNPAPAAPSFTMTISPSPVSVPIGNTASIFVNISPQNGFNQPVTLSCGALPHEATCLFGLTTVPAGGASVTLLLVSAAAPHNCGTNQPYFITPSGSTTWLGLLGTGGLILLLRRRRRLVKGIILALALCILPALSGCGNCTDLGVEPGFYTFTVTATSTGSPSATVTQTIQMIAHI